MAILSDIEVNKSAKKVLHTQKCELKAFFYFIFLCKKKSSNHVFQVIVQFLVFDSATK